MRRTGKKNYISSKINELPSEIKGQVDAILSDTSNSYQDVSGWLKGKDYEISKSSVERYTVRSGTAAQRLPGVQSRTEALVNMVRKNPDADYTEAGLALIIDDLINRLATAKDEFDYLPLDKVGRPITSLSRTEVYEDRVHQDMKDKTNLTFKETEGEIMKTIKSDPELRVRLKEILTRTRGLMLHD